MFACNLLCWKTLPALAAPELVAAGRGVSIHAHYNLLPHGPQGYILLSYGEQARLMWCPSGILQHDDQQVRILLSISNGEEIGCSFGCSITVILDSSNLFLFQWSALYSSSLAGDFKFKNI